MKNKVKPILAIAAGKETSEVSFNRYTGIAPTMVVAVCPTIEELQKLYPDRSFENSPEYIKHKEGESDMVIITFHVKTKEDHQDSQNIAATSVATIILRPEIRTSKEGKVQIINAFGDSTWITREEYEAKTLPENAVKNQFATPYRAAFVGEADLMKFIRDFANIPFYKSYKNGTWVMNPSDKLIESYCSLEQNELQQIFSGNFTVLKNLFKSYPNNWVRAPWGVRTNGDREFQEINLRMCYKAGFSDCAKKFEKELSQSGSTTDFGEYPYTFKVQELRSTTFTQGKDMSTPPPSVNPFGGAWATEAKVETPVEGLPF